MSDVYISPICMEDTADSTNRYGKDSIHCDGSYQTWIHRGYEGLTKAAMVSALIQKTASFAPNRLNKAR